MSAKSLIPRLGSRVRWWKGRPFYSAVVTMAFPQGTRKWALLPRTGVANGVWMPRHHLAAARRLEMWSGHARGQLMDTPGADAGAEANAENQAHSISRLIARDVTSTPTWGSFWVSAIPAEPFPSSLQSQAVRDAVFNNSGRRAWRTLLGSTIFPGRSARLVGVSSTIFTPRAILTASLITFPEDDAAGEAPASIVTGVEFMRTRPGPSLRKIPTSSITIGETLIGT